MNEKQKNLWKITALTLLELLVLITVCSFSSDALCFGCSGERVAEIQRKLKQSGVYGGKINGIYDFETRNAVRRAFPKSGGEAGGNELAALGIGADDGGFSSKCEIYARYAEMRMKNQPCCEIYAVLERFKPSELMRKDGIFLENVQKIEPQSGIFDIIIKFEKVNNKVLTLTQ